MRRLANCAMSDSCVTSTIVRPSSFSFWKTSMISTDVLLSRFPVGSSASQHDGRSASAGPVEATHYRPERRVSTPARAHDGGEVSATDLQGNSTQCMHPRFTQIVIFMHVLDLDQRALLAAYGGHDCGL